MQYMRSVVVGQVSGLVALPHVGSSQTRDHIVSPASVGGSPMEARIGSGLPPGWGPWQQQS